MTDTPEEEAPIHTLLAFLTTSCKPCEQFWGVTPGYSALRGLKVGLVIVTPSPAMEDEHKARALLPSGAKLVMSSSTWFDYGIGQAGTVVLTRSKRAGPPPWEARAEVLGQACPEGPAALGDLVSGWLQGSASM